MNIREMARSQEQEYRFERGDKIDSLAIQISGLKIKLDWLGCEVVLVQREM